jgi:hypothetical protein
VCVCSLSMRSAVWNSHVGQAGISSLAHV